MYSILPCDARTQFFFASVERRARWIEDTKSNIYDPASGSQQIDFFSHSLAASLPNLVKEISSRVVAVFSREKSVRLLIMEELPLLG